MAPHPSTPAWKIPWTEEPGRLEFLGLQRVGHDWAASLLRAITLNHLALSWARLFKKKKLFIYFNWRLITLQYCSGFCHTLTQISHRCTCVPHPENPSHLLPHPIPQGRPSALVLSALSHALNLDWRSIAYIVMYMFQCYSLKSSHPRLLPPSPKVFFISVSLLISCI